MTDPRATSGQVDETTIEDLPAAPGYRATPPLTPPVGPDGGPNLHDGPGAPAGAVAPRGRGFAIRWIVALLGIAIVAAGSFVIVSLAGGRPAQSGAIGYMPDSIATYAEVRLDLPGDQRQKVATFLHTGAFPGFADQANITPKIEDIYDRVVRLASHDQQTYTADIQPWFGGTMGIGQELTPLTAMGAAGSMSTASPPSTPLVVLTITDRPKALAYLTGHIDATHLQRSTYNGADYFTTSAGPNRLGAIAITDKVLVVGEEAAVKAAVDTGGNGAFASDADVKAALATVDRDDVLLTVVRLRAAFQSMTAAIASAQPGVLDRTQVDETLLKIVPAWSISTGRFEDDALVMTSAAPHWSIGVDTPNAPSTLLGHVPANTIFYEDAHDLGPTLNAIVGTFRALPETKTFFDQFDQALATIGGADGVYGWWGDAAVVVAPNTDGTIGGGLVIHPRDAASAARFLTTLHSDLGLFGASAGITVRDEDHNGTQITVLDISGLVSRDGGSVPPGYKAELAWATNQDVTVLGYGRDFVASVLDAGPGHSLGDDSRFKALLNRAGSDNLATSFVDVTAIRKLIEPLMQRGMSPDRWTTYTKEIEPFLAPFDAILGVSHSDGGLDKGTSILTVH